MPLPGPWPTTSPRRRTIIPCEGALRWAQVRGLGGREDLAEAVSATKLGRHFEHEHFWRTVLHFLIRNPDMDLDHVEPIVDFLHARRCQAREVFVPGQGIVPQPPPQPDYSVKGRTLASLLCQVREWERQPGHGICWRGRSWGRSAIGGLDYLEGTESSQTGQQVPRRCWTIRQLLTSGQLLQEGQALRHCVAVHTGSCASHRTTIWSLRVDVGQGPRRALTLLVDPARRLIRQARGYANRRPRARERAVMERWAAQEGLRIDDRL